MYLQILNFFLPIPAQAQPMTRLCRSPIQGSFIFYMFMAISACATISLHFAMIPNYHIYFITFFSNPLDMPVILKIGFGLYETSLMFLLWTHITGHDPLLGAISKVLHVSLNTISYDETRVSNFGFRESVQVYNQVRLIMDQLNETFSVSLVINKGVTLLILCCLVCIGVKVGRRIPPEAALVFWGNANFHIIRVFTCFANISQVHSYSQKYLKSWRFGVSKSVVKDKLQLEKNRCELKMCPGLSWTAGGLYHFVPIHNLALLYQIVSNAITLLNI